jgi:hypothetical protein
MWKKEFEGTSRMHDGIHTLGLSSKGKSVVC